MSEEKCPDCAADNCNAFLYQDAALPEHITICRLRAQLSAATARASELEKTNPLQESWLAQKDLLQQVDAILHDAGAIGELGQQLPGRLRDLIAKRDAEIAVLGARVAKAERVAKAARSVLHWAFARTGTQRHSVETLGAALDDFGPLATDGEGGEGG